MLSSGACNSYWNWLGIIISWSWHACYSFLICLLLYSFNLINDFYLKVNKLMWKGILELKLKLIMTYFKAYWVSTWHIKLYHYSQKSIFQYGTRIDIFKPWFSLYLSPLSQRTPSWLSLLFPINRKKLYNIFLLFQGTEHYLFFLSSLLIN